MSSSVPELTYFDGRGRAEIIRLTLTAAGVKFTEVNLPSRDFFLSLHPDLLFKQVPLLRMDGLKLTQTSAIVRYVARKHDLLGKTDVDITKVDQLFDGTRDMYNGFYPFGFMPKEEDVKSGISKALDKYLPIFNKVLADNGTGYLVGSGLTYADLGFLEVLLATLDYFDKDILTPHSAILKFHEKLCGMENIKRYVSEVRKGKNDERYVKNVKEVLLM